MSNKEVYKHKIELADIYRQVKWSATIGKSDNVTDTTFKVTDANGELLGQVSNEDLVKGTIELSDLHLDNKSIGAVEMTSKVDGQQKIATYVRIGMKTFYGPFVTAVPMSPVRSWIASGKLEEFNAKGLLRISLDKFMAQQELLNRYQQALATSGKGLPLKQVTVVDKNLPILLIPLTITLANGSVKNYYMTALGEVFEDRYGYALLPVLTYNASDTIAKKTAKLGAYLKQLASYSGSGQEANQLLGDIYPVMVNLFSKRKTEAEIKKLMASNKR